MTHTQKPIAFPTGTALVAVLSGAAAITMASPAQAQVNIEKIALTRDAAPETGLLFDRFISPSLNNNGEVAFVSILTGSGVTLENRDAMFTGFSESSLEFVARQQTGSPGLAGGTSPRFLGVPRLNNSGQIIFRGAVEGPGVYGTSDSTVFLYDNAPLQSLSRAGDAAPVADPGVNFGGSDSGFAYDFTNLNDAGHVAFTTTFVGDNVDFTNNRAVVAGPIGNLSVIAREGDAAPGAGVDTKLGNNFDSGLVLNQAGHVAFITPLTGPGVVEENNEALYANTSGELSLVARTGTAALSAGFGVSYSDIVEHDLSDNGQTIFSARLSGLPVNDTNDSGVFVRGNGSTELVLREGDAAPGVGPDVAFGTLAVNNAGVPAMDINGSGTIAVRTTLAGDTVNNDNNGAIYITDDMGDLQLVMREGEQVPGLDNGVVFTNTDFGSGLILNERGDVIIQAEFEGPGIAEENDFAIFYLGADDDYEPQIVLRQGDILDVDNALDIEDLRTVETFDINVFQNGSTFNDLGQIAFHATFTDGSEGVFLANVPEPSMAAFAAAGLALVRRRRPKK